MKKLIVAIFVFVINISVLADMCPTPAEINVSNNQILAPRGWMIINHAYLKDYQGKLVFAMAGCEFDLNMGYSKILCRYQDSQYSERYLLIESMFNGMPTTYGYWRLETPSAMLCVPPGTLKKPESCPFALW